MHEHKTAGSGPQIHFVPIADLRPALRNPRTHTQEQVSQIAASIREFGFTNPILVGPGNVIAAGHGRWRAARELGLAEVPVIRLEQLTDAQRKALAIADNQLALNGGWDPEMLRLEIDDLRADEFDLDLLGFEMKELEDLLGPPTCQTTGSSRQKPAKALPEQPITAEGGLWSLGPHRLLCCCRAGKAELNRVMGEESADVLIAGSNLAKGGCNGGALFADGEPAWGFWRAQLKPTASLYVFHSFECQRDLQTALESAGFEIRSQTIWLTGARPEGSRYRSGHRPVFYAHVKGETDPWYGGKTQSAVWGEGEGCEGPPGDDVPAGVLERAIANSSRKGDRIAGWNLGSTLLACERSGRVARLIESSPISCDRIIQQWQELTGQDAVLNGTDCNFEAARAERKGRKR